MRFGKLLFEKQEQKASARSTRRETTWREQSLEGALADVDQLVKLNPRLAYGYDNRGVVRFLKGNLDGAISDFAQAIKLDPRVAIIWSDRGAARKQKGDLEGALADCNRAIELDAHHARAYFNRAAIWKHKANLTKRSPTMTVPLSLSRSAPTLGRNAG